MAAIIPIPTKLNEPSSTNDAAVTRFMDPGWSCGKNSTRITRIAAVWTRPYAIAYRHEPSSCVQRRTGGVTEVQSDARWSGGQHLWWRDGKPGDQLELLLPVTRAGRYRILMHHCRAFDYGLLQFSLDGEKLGQPMDLYCPENINKLVILGERNLKAGEHVFTAEIVGANPAAKPRHMFGLDYLQLAPVREQGIRPKAKVGEAAIRNELPLGTLRFFESGTVRREMRFERRPIVAIFFETPDAWSSSWGGVYDRDHTIPYLFEVRRKPSPGAGSDIAF